MSNPWLNIVGIGEDGLDGLSPAARALVESAEIIIGGDRHHDLTKASAAVRIAWPSPFDAMIDTIQSYRGRRLVVLVTGDPLWFSVGARIVRAIPADQISFFPQLSAFQLAACRLGWSLADLDCLTAHGRPVENILPFVQPGARIIVLTTGAETPGQIAQLLTRQGYGDSRLVCLSSMGGPTESRAEGNASDWDHSVSDFNTLAIDCRAGHDAIVTSRLAGLPDHLFKHDGKMTKSEVRAITLGKLMPMRGALLWDIGCGSGSVAIEWMRGAADARAIGLEPRADRRALAAANALALGAPLLQLRNATAPEGLDDLPDPDAIFFGGGLSVASAETAMKRLKPFGRLVANAVTLESEACLLDLQSRHGGELVRLSIARAEAIGTMTGWRSLMPVTQWSWSRR